jgi:hypothetical protein
VGRLTKKSKRVATVVELTVEGGVYRSENGIINHNCDECRTIHMLPDGVTPRVWLSSEVETGYHKKGTDRPSWSLLHPHCRCALTTLIPGFGFTTEGLVTWIGEKHDEVAFQRNFKRVPRGEEPRLRHMGKSESLQKGMRAEDLAEYLKPWGWELKNTGTGDHPKKLIHRGWGFAVPIQQSHCDGVMDDDMVERYAGGAGFEFIRKPRYAFAVSRNKIAANKAVGPQMMARYIEAGHLEDPNAPKPMKTWKPSQDGFIHVPIDQVSGVAVLPADQWKVARDAKALVETPGKVRPIRTRKIDLGDGQVLHEVVDGHHILEAARQVGFDHVPVVTG